MPCQIRHLDLGWNRGRELILGRGSIGRVNQCDSLSEKEKKSLKMRGLKEERNMIKPVRVNEGSKKKERLYERLTNARSESAS